MQIIELEADSQATTVNTIVNHLLVKYAKIDRFLAKERFQHLPEDLVGDLFASVPEEKLVEIGGKHGRSVGFHNTVHAMTGGNSAQSIIQFLKVLCDLGSINYTEIEESRKRTFTIRHNINRQYSIFLANFVSTALKGAGVWPKIVSDEGVVAFEFEMGKSLEDIEIPEIA